MKTSTILLCIFLSLNAFSQLWPRQQTEWYYSFYGMSDEGYRHITIDRDTTIDGRNCQIYKVDGKYVAHENSTDTIYSLYTREVIVGLENYVLYHYDAHNEAFDTIINFAANIGDQWTNDFGFGPWVTTVVDITDEDFEGVNLLKYTLNKKGSFYEEDIEFYQLFGDLNGNFIYDKPAGQLDASIDTKLRCFSFYTDIGYYEFNRTNKACDFLKLTNGTDDISSNSIYVINPVVDGIVSIQNMDVNQLQSIVFYNVEGQQMDISYQINDVIHLGKQELLSGLYFYYITNNNGTINTGKVLVE